MSCHEQALGKIKIPSKEWSKLKKSLEELYTNHLKDLFEKSLYLHELVKKEQKTNKKLLIQSFMEEKFENDYNLKKVSFYDRWLIIQSLLSVEKNLVKPSKKKFTIKEQRKASKDNKVFDYQDSELSLTLDCKEKMITYSTSDGNHSVDEADESFLGRTILRLLDRVDYTTHTGGYFKYTSEYQTDSDGFPTGYRISRRYGKYKNQKYLDQSKCDLF